MKYWGERMKYKCRRCGFEVEIKSNHELDFCPVCRQNNSRNPKESFMDKVMKFGDWLCEPVPLTTDGALALAELKRAEAELTRARNRIAEAEQHFHQHLHITPKKMKQIRPDLELKLLDDDFDEENDD